MQIATACIRRPVMTTLVMLSFVMVGFFGYRQLPVAALPRVDFPTISVSAQLPGASPETMASSVASVLERQFSTIAGITSMTSTSTQGNSSIVLQFDLGRDIDGAALDVQSALSIAQRRLPDEMTTPPSYRKVNPADSPILFLALSSESVPLSTVDEYAETLIAQQISMLPGVAQVQVYGAQKYAVRVQADLHALAARGLTLGDLQTAIANANSNSPVGNLDGPSRNYTLQATGPMRKAVDFMPVVVTYAGGNPVRIEDVATVIDSVENSKVASWFQGRRAIILAVQRQPDANTVEVVDKIRATLPVLRAGVPPSVAIDVLNDKSVSIRDSVRDVQYTLMMAIALVVLVIFIFLRSATATLIPALALPVSLIGTFGGMYLFGFSIDNLSLLAITLSVGFVVDDAIVMLENIVRHVEAGMRPFEAALKGAQEIGFTIVSMTISLCAVFIPVLFMGGVVGRVFHEFGVTISMTILISGIVSLTLTPMLCSRLLRPIQHGQKHGRFFRASEAVFEAAHRGYGRTLRKVVARPGLWMIVTVLTIAATLYLYRIIPKGFFPIEDTGLIFASTEGPQDVSFDAMVARQKAIADIVQRDPYVDYVMSTVGAGGLSNTTNSGRMFIALKPRDQRDLSSNEVIQRLRREVGRVPGINAFFQNVQNLNIGGRPSKSQYQYTIQGPDFAEVERYAPILERKIAAISGAQDVTSDLQMQARHLIVDIDRERASELGIDVEGVRSLLYSAFGTRQVSTIYTSNNDYEVILEAAPRYQSSPAALDQLHVRTASGSTVPLDTIAQYPAGGGAAGGQSPGPDAGRHHLLQSGAGGGARHRRRRNRQGGAGDRPAERRRHRLPGGGPGLPGVPEGPGAAAPGGGSGHLRRARHPLRELHPPDHDLVGPAFRRHRRPAHPDADRQRLERHRDDRHRHAGRHREEECDHDDRLRPRAAARRGPAGGAGDRRGVPGPVPAHHDDDDGGHPRNAAHRHRGRCRLGAASPAGPRRGRRAPALPAPDALHHARRLCLPRPPGRPPAASSGRAAGGGPGDAGRVGTAPGSANRRAIASVFHAAPLRQRGGASAPPHVCH